MSVRHCALTAALLLTGTVETSAHAFPRPYDLPLPLGHWLIGAGAAVALSFLAAAGLMRRPDQLRAWAFAVPRQPTEALLMCCKASPS